MAHAIITRLMRVSKVVFFAICCASSASAWDRVGHLVVDAIAWEHMSEPTRERAVEILRAAPRDAGLALSGFGPRELFVRSGYWPDVVRDEAWPVRKEKYDHPTWHYVNHFWREDGTPLPEMGLNGELLERLEALAGTVPDAVELAWLLHLVGDVHQPLHSSARVTNAEPHGDRGGNDFALDDPESWGNLHAFWDSIQMRARRKHHSEGYPAWVDRIAGEIHNASFTRNARERDERSRIHRLVQSRRQACKDALVPVVSCSRCAAAEAVSGRSPRGRRSADGARRVPARGASEWAPSLGGACAVCCW